MIQADAKFRPLTLEAQTLLQEGRLAEAVRVTRESEALTPKEARARIEAHLAREPLLRAQFDARRHASRRRLFFWFVVVDMLIAAAVVYWLLQRGPA